MSAETTTGMTITVDPADIEISNNLIINIPNESVSTTLMLTEDWLRNIVVFRDTNFPDLDVELNDFRFKREQKAMIMRMKKKERRKYLKTLRSFLKS
jgi:hypothetical protein